MIRPPHASRPAWTPGRWAEGRDGRREGAASRRSQRRSSVDPAPALRLHGSRSPSGCGPGVGSRLPDPRLLRAARSREGRSAHLREVLPAAMSRSLALVRLVALVGMTLCLSAGLALARLGLTLAGYPQRAARIADRVVTLWARGTQRLLGMRIRIDGEIPEEPVAIVANHLGYIDIVALWSVVPGVFVARADVADWPLIGQAGRLIGTIFVDRTRKRDLLRVIPKMQRPLSTGGNVIFFPEGTSSPGREILPFKSSLFEPAVRCGVPVVTASLQLETAPPAAPAARSVCWWGSMTFAPHVFELLQLRSFDARIHFSSPIRPEEDRKALSRAAAESIRKTFIATTSAETETGEARETSIASGVPFSLDVSEPFEPAEAARFAKTSVPESEGGTPD